MTGGPAFFENWRISISNAASPHGTFEFVLYSDSAITGDSLEFGPYRLMNTVAHAGKDDYYSLAPVLVLRVDDYLPRDFPEMTKTDYSNYHGGSLIDEAAALVSLGLGIRLKAGPITRRFELGDKDQRGTPVAYYGFSPPVFSPNRSRPVLPELSKSHYLDPEVLDRITSILQRDREDEIALIRSARLYQQALWIAEAEPALSWLFLVSAIETAADRWDRSKGSSVERLREFKSALVSRLEEHCPDLISIVANEFADLFGSTRKFLTFTLRFLPQPPTLRPPSQFQVPWDHQHLKRTLNTVYLYRSQALHAGVPFPAPMCEAPSRFEAGWAAPTEKPLGLASGVLSGVWLQGDTPMLLHIFEYITRSALLAWWQSLAPQSRTD